MREESDGYLFTMDHIGLQEFVSKLEGLRNVIEGLRGGMKYHYDYKAIRKHVSAMVDAWCGECYRPYSLAHQRIDQLPQLTLVRARKFTLAKERPLHIRDLGSPKAEDTKDYGRCNVPNEPMCYCALYEDTALAELGAQLGDEFAIATSDDLTSANLRRAQFQH
jgi:hypothetical protein